MYVCMYVYVYLYIYIYIYICISIYNIYILFIYIVLYISCRRLPSQPRVKPPRPSLSWPFSIRRAHSPHHTTHTRDSIHTHTHTHTRHLSHIHKIPHTHARTHARTRTHTRAERCVCGSASSPKRRKSACMPVFIGSRWQWPELTDRLSHFILKPSRN